MSWEPEVPAGWALSTLGEVCDVVGGATPDTKNSAMWGDEVAWVTPADLAKHDGKVIQGGQRGLSRAGFDSCSAQMLPTGTVLYSSRAPIGHIAIAAQPMATNQGCKSVVPPEGLDSNYLYWYLTWATPEIKKLGSGTTFAEVSGKVMKSVPLLLPPAAEQGRIASLLDEQLSDLDHAIEELHPLDRHLERLEEAVIHAAVLGKLVPQTQGATPASVHLAAALDRVPAPDTPGLPALPAGWTWTTLGALCDVTGGVTKDGKKQTDPDYVEVPYLRVANVQKGRLDLDDVARIRVPPAKAEALRLLPGDVLFNEGGDRDKLGRGWVWGGQIADCIHQNHVFRGRVRGSVLDSRLLSWHGNTFGRRWFEAAGKQTTNLASLSMTNLKRLPVPVPPLEDQPAIVAEVLRRLSIIRAARHDIATVRRKAQMLRRSLLRKAFTGGLVDPDPSGEPADVLLKRIAEDRSLAAPSSRRRRVRTVSVARADPGARPVEESA